MNADPGCRVAWVALGLAALLAAGRAAGQGVAMALFSTGRPTPIASAGQLDPAHWVGEIEAIELAVV